MESIHFDSSMSDWRRKIVLPQGKSGSCKLFTLWTHFLGCSKYWENCS